jgi:cobalt-zinc-cadmium resistance protein CzcA
MSASAQNWSKPMIASMIRAALSQRLVVVVLALVMCGFGLRAAMNLSVDAFPM